MLSLGENSERRPAAAIHSRNRSFLAVRRQLKGMRSSVFELGIFFRSREKMTIYSWETKTVEKKLPWLKKVNARGADIFVRPAGNLNQGLLLIDDLDQSQLKALEEKGFLPAVVVETSHCNFQAWIRVKEGTLSPKLATASAKLLAQHFHGDPGSADWRHFGRLAGFTNRKPEHIQKNDLFPWVLLHSYRGTLAPNGQRLLQAAEKQLNNDCRLSKRCSIPKTSSSASNAFQKYFQALAFRYGNKSDFSRIDWAVSRTLLQQGFSEDEVKRAVRECSPHLAQRKAGHIEDYIERTVSKIAMNLLRRPSSNS